MSGAFFATNSSMQRAFIVALVVAIAWTAIAGAALVFADVSDETAALFVGVPALVGFCLALLVAFGAVLTRPIGPLMRVVCVAGEVLALGATALGICLIVLGFDGTTHERESVSFLAAALYGLAIALAYTAALAQVRTDSRLLRSLCVATGASVWLCAGVLLLLLLAMNTTDSDFGFMFVLMLVFGVSSLVALAGTIAVPVAVASKASRIRAAAESIDPRVQVRFGCPKCGERQTHRPGFARCSRCHAGMLIDVEEPRCECGYLLYRLVGEKCPECGRPVSILSNERHA